MSVCQIVNKLEPRSGRHDFDNHYDSCDGADAIAIVTEWNEFRNPGFDYIKLKMKSPVILDGRKLYDRTRMAARGLYHSGIGLSALPVRK